MRQAVVLLVATLALSQSAVVPVSFAFNPFAAFSPSSHFVPVQTLTPAFTATQFHAQDELGQASFGYAHPGQAATNFRDAFGNQVGSYAYINPDGKEIRVSYVADSNGFRVLSNALPEGPAPLNAALPVPVQDTPEVAAAKAAHFAAVAQVKARNAAAPSENHERRRREAQAFDLASLGLSGFQFIVADDSLPQVHQIAPVAHALPAVHQVPVAHEVPVVAHALPPVAVPHALPAVAPAVPAVHAVPHQVPVLTHALPAVPVSHQVPVVAHVQPPVVHAAPAVHVAPVVPKKSYYKSSGSYEKSYSAPVVKAVVPEVHHVVPAPAPVALQHLPAVPVVHEAPALLPVPAPLPVAHVAAPSPLAVPAVTVDRFHAQDELGQASFGHSTPDQAHSAFRDAFGNQVGSYVYINPEGKEVRVHYTAGVGGFRVLSNALPEAPSATAVFDSHAIVQDTPDVLAARKAFFATFEEARNRIKKPSH